MGPRYEELRAAEQRRSRVGTRWHNTSKIVGATAELTYTLTGETDDTLTFVGQNERATSTNEITVTRQGRGSRIRYRADLQVRGAAKLATPVMTVVFEKLGNDTQKQMIQVLNGLPTT